MGPRPAHIAADADGNRRDGAFAVPATRSRGRWGMFILTAAAGLALGSAAVTGTPGGHAAAAVSARPVVAVQAHPGVEPCLCDNPVCRPVCHQSMDIVMHNPRPD